MEGSLQDFDTVLQVAPQQRPCACKQRLGDGDCGLTPVLTHADLWQRGLSLYYVQRYAEGAKQFRDDVAVNPNDTEESIWALVRGVDSRFSGWRPRLG